MIWNEIAWDANTISMWFTQIMHIKGACIWNFNPQYLPDWLYLRQKSGHKTLKEWSEHKGKVIFELNTHENFHIDSFFDLIWGYNLWLVVGHGW